MIAMFFKLSSVYTFIGNPNNDDRILKSEGTYDARKRELLPAGGWNGKCSQGSRSSLAVKVLMSQLQIS